jgi:hypothetical protein
VDFLSTLDIFRGVPAANTFALESIMEPLGECFVLVRITDETRVKLERFIEESREISYQRVGKTTSLEETKG